jgi:hypothetical protein
VEGVDRDPNPVGRRIAVSARQVTGDPLGLGIEREDGDVEVRGVIRDSRLAPERRSRPLSGFPLQEVGHRRGEFPELVGEITIEPEGGRLGDLERVDLPASARGLPGVRRHGHQAGQHTGRHP